MEKGEAEEEEEEEGANELWLYSVNYERKPQVCFHLLVLRSGHVGFMDEMFLFIPRDPLEQKYKHSLEPFEPLNTPN